MDLAMYTDPSVLTEILLQGLVRGSMYALMASGLSLIFGILGVNNFAHGELFMIGSYTMFFIVATLQLPFVAGLVAAALVLFLVGMLIERGLIEQLRKRAGRDWLLDSFVLTIGLMILLQNLALVVFGSNRLGIPEMVSGSLIIGSIIISYERLIILAVAALTVLLLWAFIRFTAPGKAIRATAQNPEAALALGIDTMRVHTYTFGLGAALAGLSGALLISIFPAYPTVGLQPIVKSVAVVILGGLGYVPGAIVAGLLLGVIEAFAYFTMSAGWQNVLTAALVVLIMIFRPYGLFSSAKGERP